MAYGSELLVQSYSWLIACILVLLLVDGEYILSVKTGTGSSTPIPTVFQRIPGTVDVLLLSPLETRGNSARKLEFRN